MKLCNTCNRYLVNSKFFKRSKSVKLRHQCKDCTNKANLERHYKSDKTNKRINSYRYNLKTNYNLSVEEYNLIYNSQNGKCPICDKLLSNQFLNIVGEVSVLDHCHKTGKNRSILCTHCNKGLGSFFDNSFNLIKASKYIENHNI